MIKSKSKQWSDAELEEQGYNKIVIGVPGRPFPVMMANPNATSPEDAFRLENIEDPTNPIVIWSKRRYDEVVGMLYRNLPTPTMLPLFYETLQLLQLENDRRIQFYVGKHGSGKSFLGRMVGDILHPDGAITYNCADRDLNELLFETVLDVEANPDLYTKINMKLKEGSMNSTSINALQNAVGEAYTEENGYPEIDFGKVGGTKFETYVNEDGLTETEAIPPDANVHNVVEVLLKIAQIEGLSKEASFMPLKSQLGLLPRVWQEGRVAHLEEYNKCKEGTDTCLHPVLQVYNGEYRKCTVFGSGGLSFTFDNHSREPGFFCYLDGNMQTDGVATRSLSASANDRLLPNIIQDMIKEDWQHRWCQLLTGIPIKVLYESNRDQWEANPEEFTRFLHMVRSLGGAEVPEAHTRYINRWEDVLDATDIISKYNYLYDQMTNPDSPANRNGEYPELFTEVDEDFHNIAGGSMRRNIYYLKMAILGRPQTLQPQLSQGYDLTRSWEEPPSVNPISENRKPELKLGTHIVDILYRDMVRMTLGVGKTNLYTRLRVEFENLRLMKPQLNEGLNSAAIFFEDLLNLQDTGSDRSGETQSILCDQLRSQLEGTKLSGDNDHLLTMDQIGTAISKAMNASAPANGDARLSFIHVQQYMPLVTVDNLFRQVAVLDSTQSQDNSSLQLTPDKLLDINELLIGLGLPKIGKVNLAAFWNTTLMQGFDSPVAEDDEALQISCGTSGHGLAFTSLICSRKENDMLQECVLHLLRDDHSGESLIVGTGADDRIVAWLKEAGVHFADTRLSHSKGKIRNFLGQAFSTRAGMSEQTLVAAFFHRNEIPDAAYLQSASAFASIGFADLVLDRDSRPDRPVYASKLQEVSKIRAELSGGSVPA